MPDPAQKVVISMKGMVIMKKNKRILSMILTVSAIFAVLLATAIPAYAAAPKDNGSTAKAAVNEEMKAVACEESEAFPAWILFTVIGGICVAGVTAGAIIIGRKNENDD